jgi:hypothetical protein
MAYIFTVYATLFLLTLHVSTLVGHHQVLTVRHNLLSNYNATFVHLFFYTFRDVSQ